MAYSCSHGLQLQSWLTAAIVAYSCSRGLQLRSSIGLHDHPSAYMIIHWLTAAVYMALTAAVYVLQKARLTAAIPMANPYCSCRLTRVRSRRCRGHGRGPNCVNFKVRSRGLQLQFPVESPYCSCRLTRYCVNLKPPCDDSWLKVRPAP